MEVQKSQKRLRRFSGPSAKRESRHSERTSAMNSVQTNRRGFWKCGGALERKRWVTCDGGEGAAEEVLFSVKRLGPVENLSRLEPSEDLRIALWHPLALNV